MTQEVPATLDAADKRWQEALSIAARVRQRAETLAKNYGYDPITLAHICGVTSLALCEALQKNDIPAQIASGWYLGRNNIGEMNCHTWVEVGDHIIDLTATQYHADAERVSICPINSYKYERIYQYHSVDQCLRYVGCVTHCMPEIQLLAELSKLDDLTL